ncbi:MAG: DUF4426 domain-containing protein [Pseudomonadales bacterium]|nr:DUF4426 domain-containing protein [Pseudomonadales bacterium]
MTKLLRGVHLVCGLIALGILAPSYAEQKVTAGDHEIHYIIFPTTFLRPNIASQYDIARGKNRSLVNVSVLNKDGNAVRADVTGRSRNLLEQGQTLNFSMVEEGSAVYYLALLSHGDEEVHRVEIEVELADGTHKTISMQQKLYWEE